MVLNHYFLNHLCDGELKQNLVINTAKFLNHLCDGERFIWGKKDNSAVSKPSMRWRTPFDYLGACQVFSKPSMRWRTVKYRLSCLTLFSKPSMRWRTRK